jgi:hypothetical protein
MPSCVIAGVVIVGDNECAALAMSPDAEGPSIAFARPKSSTFTVPSSRTFDVGGLQIAMNDGLLMRGLEGFGDLSCNRQRFVDQQRSCADPIGERRSLDKLHHQRLDVVSGFPGRRSRVSGEAGGRTLLETVNDRDVGMIQRGERPRLTLEPCESVGVLRE